MNKKFCNISVASLGSMKERIKMKLEQKTREKIMHYEFNEKLFDLKECLAHSFDVKTINKTCLKKSTDEEKI